jgi:nucleolar protein 4
VLCPQNTAFLLNKFQCLFFCGHCRLERTKTTKLQSPNFHISRTRLIIYNLPKSMTEKGLKKLCIDAVTLRATKQKPVIKQVGYIYNYLWCLVNALLCLYLRKFFLSLMLYMQIKFMKDTKKGKVVAKNNSRGVAFVEFTEHQHALVALRVLNNNPGKILLINY